MPPLETPLDISPYFDSGVEEIAKNYYRILFKPTNAVQVRELNAIQDIIQNQIESFGDNIFKRGTIIQGCNFIFYNNYPYVKIIDNDLTGTPINVNQFLGLNVVDSANLISLVVGVAPGFVSQDPNLNTLYLRYLNSGNTGSMTAYSAGESLTVFNGNNVVEKINIIDGASGFTNSDTIVVASALAIQNSIGGVAFSNGSGGTNTFNINDTINYVSQAGANVSSTIVGVNALANSAALILSVVPLTTDLQNTSTNAANWTFAPGAVVYDTVTNTQFTVSASIGVGAAAYMLTDSFGKVSIINVTDEGVGYYFTPEVTIKSPTGALASLNLTAQNFLTQFTVATTANAVGYGYAFAVTAGIIYQKGFFLQVANNTTVVVSKYTNAPDQLAVGFNTNEFIVNSNIDQTLLDNSSGTLNQFAPGADRLRLTPTLVVQTLSDIAANDEFFSLVEWAAGQPFKQNRQTAFNQVQNEIAQTADDIAGDFVLQPFLVSTGPGSSMSDEANNFNLIVSPGTAYISGDKVVTQTNYNQEFPKATTTQTYAANPISINYGNYVLVNNLGGHFIFDTGAYVSLRSAALGFIQNTGFISTSNSTNITPAGIEIGQARIRGILYDNRNGTGGIPGSPQAQYRIYLFGLNMNQGYNFANVMGLALTTGVTYDAVADIIASDQGNTHFYETANNTLIFPIGTNATSNVFNVNYVYRSETLTANANTTGIITFSATTGETFFANNILFDSVLCPLVNVTSTTNATGTITSAANTLLTGSGTSFTSSFVAGDYIICSDGIHTDVKRISYIVNNTVMGIDSNSSYSNTTSALKLILPQDIPVNLTRSGTIVSISANGTVLTINLANTFTGTANYSLSYTVMKSNAAPIVKTVHRNVFVQLNLSNNVTSNTGPWCLGVPDVIRLDAVYLGNSTSNSLVTADFYINGGQNENYLDLASLVLRPSASLALSNTQLLLVELDCLTPSSPTGYADISSYPINDMVVLASAASSMHTLEVPELYGVSGTYYDLRDCIDFRPISANTANIATTTAGATVNPPLPSAVSQFGNTANLANDKRFPHPVSIVNTSVTYYLGRKDVISINSNGDYSYAMGKPDVIGKANPPLPPTNALLLNTLIVPPYPSEPMALSANTIAYLDNSIVNGLPSGTRKGNYTISFYSNGVISQPRGYTMKQIGSLEQRITNLEAVVLINQVENAVQNTPLTEVYGFFVDNFTTLNFADYNNPEYNATIMNGELLPAREQITIPFVFSSADKYATLPYQNYALISQLNATDGCTANTSVTQQTISTFTARSISQPCYLDTLKVATTGPGVQIRNFFWDIFQFTFSATSGPAVLYFDSSPIPLYFPFIIGPDIFNLRLGHLGHRFYIFQSQTPTLPPFTRPADTEIHCNDPLYNSFWSPYLLTTCDSLVNCTTAEKQALNNFDHDFAFAPHPSGIGNCFNGLGKVQWTHNPANGLYYTVVVVKAAPDFFMTLKYPTDTTSVTVCGNENQPTPVDYHGILTMYPTTYKIRLVCHTTCQGVNDFRCNFDCGNRCLPKSFLDSGCNPPSGY